MWKERERLERTEELQVFTLPNVQIEIEDTSLIFLSSVNLIAIVVVICKVILPSFSVI